MRYITVIDGDGNEEYGDLSKELVEISAKFDNELYPVYTTSTIGLESTQLDFNCIKDGDCVLVVTNRDEESVDDFKKTFPKNNFKSVTHSEYWTTMTTKQIAKENGTDGRIIRRYIANGRLKAIKGKKKRSHKVERLDWEEFRRTKRKYSRRG